MSSRDSENLLLDSSGAHVASWPSHFDGSTSTKPPVSLKCRVNNLVPSINSPSKHVRTLSDNFGPELSVFAATPAIEAGVIVDDDKLFYDFLGSPSSSFASGDDTSLILDMLPPNDEDIWLSPLSIVSENSQNTLVENISALLSSEYKNDAISVTEDSATSPRSPVSFLASNLSTISRSSESYFPTEDNHTLEQSFEYYSKIPDKPTEIFDPFDLENLAAKINDDSTVPNVVTAGVSDWKRSIRLQNVMTVEIKKQQAENWERLQREKKEQKEIKKQAAKERKQKSKNMEVHSIKLLDKEIGDPDKRVKKKSELLFSDSEVFFNSEDHDGLNLDQISPNHHPNSENHLSLDLENDLKVFEFEQTLGDLNSIIEPSILELQDSKDFEEPQNTTETESSSIWNRFSSLRRLGSATSAGSEPLLSTVNENEKFYSSVNQSVPEIKSVWNRIPSLRRTIDTSSDSLELAHPHDDISKCESPKSLNRIPDNSSIPENSMWDPFSVNDPKSQTRESKSEETLYELESDSIQNVSNKAETISVHTVEPQVTLWTRFSSLRLSNAQSTSTLNSDFQENSVSKSTAENPTDTPTQSNNLWNRLSLRSKTSQQTSVSTPPVNVSSTTETSEPNTSIRGRLFGAVSSLTFTSASMITGSNLMALPNDSTVSLGLESDRSIPGKKKRDDKIDEEEEEGDEDFLTVLWGAVDRDILDNMLKMKGWRLCPGLDCRYIHRSERIPKPVCLDSAKSSEYQQTISTEESLTSKYPHAVVCQHCCTAICFKCGEVLTKGEVLATIVDVEEELETDLQQKVG
ncbi:hypothetical protein HK096_004896, partial [Nowakowskiella sp. JEL0078]